MEKDGFHYIVLLPDDMREQLRRLPANKKQWPRDFHERYRRLHAEFTSSKAAFVAWARKDRDRRMTRTAKILLSYLVDCLNFETSRCDPSQQTIADEIGVCSRTVERVIRQIVAAGWLEVYRRGKTATNFYRLRVTAEKLAAISDAQAARWAADDATAGPAINSNNRQCQQDAGCRK
ncbi:helix-turn-helix domain-containing protein [Shinella zoogloeoides]|uniref:helix-turn-helix domain-containing protein n=1 Tax=Shinella zoogloeoides TaxID=352475 RepID=UPI0013C2DC74|nr:helix-turn-helix domain-containing protein [Shinella zoogloeoides]